jgi:glycosyltransferase involved in cell wall biosynthesis
MAKASRSCSAVGYPNFITTSPAATTRVITIITATYNAAPLLPGLIASLRAQTDHNFEWVVADGASTDGTQAVLRDASDVVTCWISEPDFGIYHALNKALALATGEYYVVVGCDDTLAPDAVEAFRRAAIETRADIIAAPVRVGDRVEQPRTRLAWLRSGPPQVAAHSVGTLIRRSLHDELGLYSRRYPIAADTLFLLEAERAGKRFVHLDAVVGSFGTAGASSADTLGALCESWRANVAVRGRYWLQLPLFVLRLLVNGPRIVRSTARRRPA